jgi:hypothetical protein
VKIQVSICDGCGSNALTSIVLTYEEDKAARDVGLDLCLGCLMKGLHVATNFLDVNQFESLVDNLSEYANERTIQTGPEVPPDVRDLFPTQEARSEIPRKP